MNPQSTAESVSRLQPPTHAWRWVALALLAVITLSGCATASSGPSASSVEDIDSRTGGIAVVEVNDAVARRVTLGLRSETFAVAMPSQASKTDYQVAPGDLLEISIWEAPPASLFGASASLSFGTSGGSTRSSIPEQIVGSDGNIAVPFAGLVMVQGKTPRQIEADIVQRLRGKANQPQVIVRVANNASANVTVVGEVAKSLRMPLTPKGERLLDAIAAAGGVSQPTNKTTVQLSRMGKVVAMPMDQIIQDPAQNVHLQPGDVVTAVTKPLSMTVLGATGKNEEVSFEAQGISLAQALGRAGGLADNRADARGLFVFRFEDPMVLPDQGKGRIQTAEGKVPVVYRVDLSDPRSFLVAQHFPIKHQDVVYVSNAPAAELQKFLNILTSSVFTAAGLGSLGSN